MPRCGASHYAEQVGHVVVCSLNDGHTAQHRSYSSHDLRTTLLAEWESVTTQFTSGAKSSEVKPRYDLVPQRALECIARRFELGIKTHGERNYRKGAQDSVFLVDRINHLIEHTLQFAEHRRTSDLAAVLCNAAMLAELGADTERDMPEVHTAPWSPKNV
jgi:hypothetical protein